MDKKANLYEIGGVPLEIPVVWDEYSQRYLEDYRSFIANPVFTPEGRPIMLTIEDACRYSQPAKGETECVDCGSCRYYSQTAGTLLGVCGHEKMRAGEKPQPEREKKEETKP